jgi:hypothetical protein
MNEKLFDRHYLANLGFGSFYLPNSVFNKSKKLASGIFAWLDFD